MRVIQVLDALDFGDGVSNDVINKYHLLKDLGYQTEIYSKWTHEKVAAYRSDIKNLHVQKEDIIIHHFSGESHILDFVLNAHCFKVLQYHNITPDSFFDAGKTGLTVGELQLQKVKSDYNIFLCDSEYNAQCLRSLGICTSICVLPVAIDFSSIQQARRWDIRDNADQKVFLFVGRVAPNKKHEDVIRIFNEYNQNINSNSKLYLAGNYKDYMDYYSQLQVILEGLPCRTQVVFTGKVDNNELYNCYKNADIFLCMSEHEGFCIPLLESMSCGIPTVAYDACAVASTMMGAGVLIRQKDPVMISRLIHTIFSNGQIRAHIISKQFEVVKAYSLPQVSAEFERLINGWKEKLR